MSEARIGILVNSNIPKNDEFPQRLHLLIVRFILYFCHSFEEVSWGYYLTKFGQETYKKMLMRNVTVKDAQKLLTDLVLSSNYKNTSNIGWSEVATLVLSDFNWDISSTNYLFIFSNTLPPPSETKNIFTRLKKDNNVKLAFVDVNSMIGCPSLTKSEISEYFLYIPAYYLTSEISHLIFKQLVKYYISGKEHTFSLQEATFIKDVIVIDDDDDDDIMKQKIKKWHLSPLDGNVSDNSILCLTYINQLSSFDFCASYCDPSISYLVFFDEIYCAQINSPVSYSFLVESQEIGQDKKETHTYLIKHLSNTCGAMFRLPNYSAISHILSKVTDPTNPDKEPFQFPSLHILSPDNMELTNFTVSFQLKETTCDNSDEDLMEEIYQFHNLNINDSKPPVSNLSTVKSNSTDIKLEELIEKENWKSASEEALSQSMPLAVQRQSLAALVRKYQGDIKLELSSPTKLKAKLSNGTGYDNDKLIKEHKIQIVLHLLEYCEFSDCVFKDKTYKSVLALLRSLTFLTSPTDMFDFLNNQILEEFHGDCTDLLRDVYEEGFLMEVPGILVSDSNSFSSSILSVHGVAPLYCEDTNTSTMSPFGLDNNSQQSNTTLSRKHSWMDPCQNSQHSSFSITVPKTKKKKKKHRDSSKIAALVCSQKQTASQGSVKLKPNWTSKITPTDDKQSSKRRKLTRKNSVLDTPLKKQVKNPNTAKTSRARQRIKVTPKKSPGIIQIQESPIRDRGTGRASSFFGSQAQPKRFFVKDGFKTPTIPIFRLPHSSTEEAAAPTSTPVLFSSPDSDNIPQHNFTPPGTPKSMRKSIKKLSYSPMRTLFTDVNNVGFSASAINSDYINMNYTSDNSNNEKENDLFFPSINSLDNISKSPVRSFSKTMAQALEPIYNSEITGPGISEDAQMPTYLSSPSRQQGTINIQSSGGFLKMLESSSMDSFLFGQSADSKKVESDNESDISVSSSVSAQRSILKSPFHRTMTRKRLSVSFSLDNDNLCFSDENESSHDYGNLINLVDGSIKMDLGVPSEFGPEIELHNLIKENNEIETTSNTADNNAANSFYGKRKRLVSSEYDN